MGRTIKGMAVAILLLQLLVGQWIPGTGTASAAKQTESVKTKILEITESGESDFSAKAFDDSYDIDTMSMKRFVALRDELDGKYDVIYLGSGTYSTASLPYDPNDTPSKRAAKHDTKRIKNDITGLKAEEIKRSYIDKGLLVVLHKDVFSQKNSNLAKYFEAYKHAPKNNDNNVYVVNNASEASAHIRNFTRKNGERPRLEVTSSPVSYSQSSSYVYKAGDVVTFDFVVPNYDSLTDKNLTANLYIDTDFNNRYEPVELVSQTELSANTGRISYTLPGGYSGIRYWKLEVVSQATGLKDYQTGIFRFRDQKVEVKVLQVTKSGDTSSLKKQSIMKQSYLSSPDYEISIDVTDMGGFNQSVYKTINGKYDMLIFGFADVYNHAPISDQAAQAVERFISTGQSVMFTHDTIFKDNPNDNNNWVKYFMDDTGQIEPRHNIGYGAPNVSTSTKKVNDGLINQFPFLLDDNIAIAQTHNQYYTLDLEDPAIIPWYNIIGQNRDPDDSWYHYYTYSKGNVTYSGTGHTNTGFPDEEQKLFVNTMYRAFLGSNHSPVIQVMQPQDGVKIKTTDKLNLVYSVSDWDLSDTYLQTKVSINGEVKLDQRVRNGQIIQKTLDNPLTTNGQLKVTIEATDDRGAKESKELTIYVEQVVSTLVITREIVPEKVAKDTQAAITYTISPLPIPHSLTIDKVTGVTYRERFPAGLEVIPPNGWKKSGTITTGYTIEGTLPDIAYQKVGNVYRAQPVSFSIQVIPGMVPQPLRLFTLDDAMISYRDIDNQSKTLAFPTLSFEVFVPLTGLALDKDQLVMEPGQADEKLLVEFEPEDATNKAVTWSSSDKEVAAVSQNGVVTAKQPGVAIITVVSDENPNLTATAKVIVTAKPVVTLGVSDGQTRQGWTEMYPEQAEVTIEVVYHSFEELRSPPDVRINGTPVEPSALAGPSRENLGNGKVKAVYRLPVNVRQWELIGKVPITAQASSTYGKTSNLAQQTLICNPLTGFTVTSQTDGSGTGSLTAVAPDPKVFPKVLPVHKFGWKYHDPHVTQFAAATADWQYFERTASNIPLLPGGTQLVVAMFQDFNEDGEYSGLHEIVPYPELIAFDAKPSFEMEILQIIGDSALLEIRPAVETLLDSTIWTITDGDDQDRRFATGVFDSKIVAAEYRKDAAGNLLPTTVEIAAGNPLAGGSNPAAWTKQAIPLPITDEADPVIRITVDPDLKENRASKITIQYDVPTSADSEKYRIRITEAALTIDGIKTLLDNASFSNQIVRYLKTDDGTSKTFQIDVSIQVEVINVKTGELVKEFSYRASEMVPYKANQTRM
jgi:hypothetical protein